MVYLNGGSFGEGESLSILLWNSLMLGPILILDFDLDRGLDLDLDLDSFVYLELDPDLVF